MSLEKELIGRTRQFAIRVVYFVRQLPKDVATEIVSKQLLRSATSVGANYRAACRARSKADFIAKLGIVEEEADEVQYWLELLYDLKMVSDPEFRELHGEASELTAIFASSVKTAKQNR